ncbi:MAG: PAS domain S-box protein [Brevibacillus sp.]|nr:PAS domain S-box protein [Brevibacillus sp.]
MLHFFRSRIMKRYLLLTLVVILFTLTSLYYLTIQVLDSSVREQIELRDDLIARTLGKRIGFTITKMLDDMRFASSYVRKVNEREFYLSEMQGLVARNPLYLSIQAYDKDGSLLVRIPDVTMFDSNEIRRIHDRLSWSKTYYVSDLITLQDGRKTFAVAYSALDENEAFLGAVIAFVNINVLSDYLKELKIGQRGINAVVDREGRLIAVSSRDIEGTSLKNHVLGQYLYKERFGIWEGELFDQRMIVAYRPVIYGFGLIVGEPITQSLEPAYHVMIVLFQGFLVVLLIAVGLGVYGTARVVKPILELTSQVKEYRENKRRKFRPILTRDELQDLSVVMGEMAKELTDKERRLFYILESIPYCIITTDRNGKITTFNKGAEELTLYKREEVIGKSIVDLPLKASREDFISLKTLQEGKAFEETESYIYDKHMVKHDVRIYSSLFHGEYNEVAGTIIVMKDVSDIKKLELYLKQSERLASLGQLTAGVAHEIKNPLSIIHAAAEAIQLELKDEQPKLALVSELTGDILESTDRMNRLLADFLKLSKEEPEGNRTWLNIIELLNELLHLLRNKWNDRGIEVIRSYEAEEAWVFGDKNRLTQVFLNIFLNSLDAMENGGTLIVRVKEIKQHWEISVSDTGKGIPQGTLRWIFNPFFSTKPEGTGLGLSIAHEIILQHQGKIYADSELGQGTTLYVQLPKEKGE